MGLKFLTVCANFIDYMFFYSHFTNPPKTSLDFFAGKLSSWPFLLWVLPFDCCSSLRLQAETTENSQFIFLMMPFWFTFPKPTSYHMNIAANQFPKAGPKSAISETFWNRFSGHFFAEGLVLRKRQGFKNDWCPRWASKFPLGSKTCGRRECAGGPLEYTICPPSQHYKSGFWRRRKLKPFFMGGELWWPICFRRTVN